MKVPPGQRRAERDRLRSQLIDLKTRALGMMLLAKDLEADDDLVAELWGLANKAGDAEQVVDTWIKREPLT